MTAEPERTELVAPPRRGRRGARAVAIAALRGLAVVLAGTCLFVGGALMPSFDSADPPLDLALVIEIVLRWVVAGAVVTLASLPELLARDLDRSLARDLISASLAALVPVVVASQAAYLELMVETGSFVAARGKALHVAFGGEAGTPATLAGGALGGLALARLRSVEVPIQVLLTVAGLTGGWVAAGVDPCGACCCGVLAAPLAPVWWLIDVVISCSRSSDRK